MDREAFILSFLDYSRALAHRRYYLAEPEDIAQECMVTVVQICDKAMAADVPWLYARTAMIQTANAFAHGDGLIRKPRDVIRGQTEEEYTTCTITDKLIHSLAEPTKEEEPDWSWLYALVDQLPLRQREAIGTQFGLVGYGYYSQTEAGKLRGANKLAIQSRKKQGLRKLREILTGKGANEKLKSAREACGWTQTQMARYLEVSRDTYYTWERRGVVPNEENVKKLCGLLKKTPEELGFENRETNNVPLQ